MDDQNPIAVRAILLESVRGSAEALLQGRATGLVHGVEVYSNAQVITLHSGKETQATRNFLSFVFVRRSRAIVKE